MKKLERKFESLTPSLIENILKAGLKNNNYSKGDINQVLESRYAKIFFDKLLSLSIDKQYSLTPWKEFYLSLNSNCRSKFNCLKKKLEEKEIKFDLEENNSGEDVDIPDNIPF